MTRRLTDAELVERIWGAPQPDAAPPDLAAVVVAACAVGVWVVVAVVIGWTLGWLS